MKLINVNVPVISRVLPSGADRRTPSIRTAGFGGIAWRSQALFSREGMITTLGRVARLTTGVHGGVFFVHEQRTDSKRDK
jgi:hypothetical protein